MDHYDYLDDEYKFYIDGFMTSKLDESLKTKQDLDFEGLEGTGKTSIMKQWLHHNKDKVSGYYIDCALIEEPRSGVPHEKNGLDIYGQLFTSEEIDEIESMPNRVIVFDNYHLASDNLRRHVILLSDRYVIDEREEDGFKKLRNIAFICMIKTEEVGKRK